MQTIKQIDVSKLVREENWLLRDVDVYARSVLQQQPHPVRVIDRRKLFVDRIGWFTITAFLLFLSGCIYAFSIRLPSIMSGDILMQRGGWAFVATPIITLFIISIFYIATRNDYVALKYGQLGVGILNTLSTQPNNAVIQGNGKMTVYTIGRSFDSIYQSQTLNNQWMGQITKGDTLLVLVHPDKNLVLVDYGPITSDDVRFFQIACEEK
jgi:hypothetical protein